MTPIQWPNRRFGVSLAFVMAIAGDASASLLVDPSGGTTLFTSADDETTHRNLGFTGTFFAQRVTAVDVSSNGNLNFSADVSPTDQALPFGPARISPLWDDWYLSGAPGESITEKVIPGMLYSITYSNVETFNTGDQFTFQVIWFGASTTLDGFSFGANDIAFAYGGLGANLDDNHAIAGLNAGDGLNAASVPGTTNGVITNATKGTVLLLGPQFILFRPTGFGDYQVSINTYIPPVVPEPGSAGLLIVGLITFWIKTRRTNSSPWSPGGK